MDKTIDEYFKLEKEIHDYFGYQEDWVVIPLDDSREYDWILHEENDGSGYVRFSEEKEKLLNVEAGEYYEDQIYTQRFLPKWVYRTRDHTLICVDTRVDGNKFIRIFDNKKEIDEITGDLKLL